MSGDEVPPPLPAVVVAAVAAVAAAAVAAVSGSRPLSLLSRCGPGFWSFGCERRPSPSVQALVVSLGRQENCT